MVNTNFNDLNIYFLSVWKLILIYLSFQKIKLLSLVDCGIKDNLIHFSRIGLDERISIFIQHDDSSFVDI